MPWRQDIAVMERLAEVERRVLAGMHNTAIAGELGVSEATIRDDRKRLSELWLEQVGGDVKARRLVRIAQLQSISDKALAAAQFDERMERAVLLGEPMGTRQCPGIVDHGDGLVCPGPHAIELRVHRDDKGSAQFRGNKSAALNVARQALMDAAKIEGIVVDKVSPTDPDGKTLDLAGLVLLARQEGQP